MAQAPVEILSHWYHLTENLQASSLEFYKAVEQALERRQVPGARPARVSWPESGWFSARRQYLRIKRKKLVFDICAAPFGNGFFISWWMGPLPNPVLGLLLMIPVLGLLVAWMVRPWTYYKMDTALMFQSTVSSAVQEVLDEMTRAKGLRALEAFERKPVLREFAAR